MRQFRTRTQTPSARAQVNPFAPAVAQQPLFTAQGPTNPFAPATQPNVTNPFAPATQPNVTNPFAPATQPNVTNPFAPAAAPNPFTQPTHVPPTTTANNPFTPPGWDFRPGSPAQPATQPAVPPFQWPPTSPPARSPAQPATQPAVPPFQWPPVSPPAAPSTAIPKATKTVKFKSPQQTPPPAAPWTPTPNWPPTPAATTIVAPTTAWVPTAAPPIPPAAPWTPTPNWPPTPAATTPVAPTTAWVPTAAPPKPLLSHKARLTAFYQKHNPSKLSSVDATLAKYRGCEAELFKKLEQKYNVRDAAQGTPTHQPRVWPPPIFPKAATTTATTATATTPYDTLNLTQKLSYLKETLDSSTTGSSTATAINLSEEEEKSDVPPVPEQQQRPVPVKAQQPVPVPRGHSEDYLDAYRHVRMRDRSSARIQPRGRVQPRGDDVTATATARAGAMSPPPALLSPSGQARRTKSKLVILKPSRPAHKGADVDAGASASASARARAREPCGEPCGEPRSEKAATTTATAATAAAATASPADREPAFYFGGGDGHIDSAADVSARGRLTPDLETPEIHAHKGPGEDLASSPPSAADELSELMSMRPPSLTKTGYTCDPPIEALALADPSELKAVENFTVTHAGVGSVKWLQPVDLRGADLDRDVIIAPRSVSLYERLDDDTDETHGSRTPLKDAPAVVTLENVFYKGSSPKKQREFAARVEEKTNGMDGATFLSYGNESGRWQFAVSSWK